MSEFRIDMSKLDRPQLEELVQHLHECLMVQIANNNGFIKAMQDRAGLPDDCADLMNVWSDRSNHISEKSDAELIRIISGGDGRTVN